MATDLDSFSTPDEYFEGREIFDPVNAWPDASARIYVATHRKSRIAIYQYGWDPSTGRSWLREKSDPSQPWGSWNSPTGPLPPVLVAVGAINARQGVLMRFDLPLDPASIPAPADFTVMASGNAQTINLVSVSGSDCTLGLAAQYPPGGATVSYVPPAVNMLQSVDGMAVEAFTDVAVAV